MAISRADLLLTAGELLDAVYSNALHPRYSNTTWLNRTLGLIHMQEWKGILTTAPYYQVAERTVNTDASGLVQLAALDGGAADTREHTFRALEVAVDGQPFQYVPTKDYPFAASEGTSARVWLERGRAIQVPSIINGVVTALVSFFPCRADLLSNDTQVVGFPDGYELLLAYMLGARMGGKGAEEAGAAEYLKGEAAEIRAPMLIDIRKIAERPTRIEASDDRSDWEGFGG